MTIVFLGQQDITSAFKNKSKWLLIVGMRVNAGVLTLAPGSLQDLIQVNTPDGNTTIDAITLATTQEAVTPSSTATVYLIQLSHKLVVPPFHQIGASSFVNKVVLIQFDDISEMEGWI